MDKPIVRLLSDYGTKTVRIEIGGNEVPYITNFNIATEELSGVIDLSIKLSIPAGKFVTG